jgi:ribosomal protein L7Ae-like RNA K-turn-binding protein
MKVTERRARSALRLLGLARRAGAVAPGTEAVRRAIREGKARLILFAKDASSVQLEKIRTTLHDRSIPRAVLGDRTALGAAVGFARLSAVAVTDRSLADRLVAELAEPADEGGSDEVEA